ncbi:MAG: hypothetical protein J6O03_07800 [Butyrivibrio sp.]|nr:hypothetical protein [Butyrivibrio sp.]
MKKYIFGLILIISLALSIFYGTQKAGFHEDEYYTYYSSNRSIGLFQPDREWQERQAVLDEFAVKPGEGFNYGMVKLVQSWDVHPPFYYFLFHTLCSFVPGQFTKWTGLITNLLAFVVAFVFLVLLMKRLGVPLPVEVAVLLFWGLNPQTVSCNMLIRMYAWLGAALIACALFHIKLIQDFDNNSLEIKDFVLRSLLPIMITSYIGFLIQYFYIFFFVGIGFLTTVWIVFLRKDIKMGLIYVAGCAVSLALAVLTYPSAPRHMFGGYRGGDASGSLFDLANTWMRLSFFTGLFNDFVFAGGLLIIVLIIFMGLLLKITSKKRVKKEGKTSPRPEIIILTLASLGYFLLTSKTALLVGSASNRYEMPIYPLLILLIFMDVYYVLSDMGNKALIYAMGAILIALLLKGHLSDKSVLFLYPEDTEKIEYAAGNADEVAVVMFNPKTPQNVWRLTDELLEYPKVFYMDEENLDKITDPAVTGADKIILYAADDELQEDAFENLFDSCKKLSAMSSVFTEDMWTTYEVN